VHLVQSLELAEHLQHLEELLGMEEPWINT
jgi:hypothetical protein